MTSLPTIHLPRPTPEQARVDLACRHMMIGHARRLLDLAADSKCDLRAVAKQMHGTADLITAELDALERQNADAQ